MKIKRYPLASDSSLRAWNAADELLLAHFWEQDQSPARTLVVHDLFGYLSCHLSVGEPVSVITFDSQRRSLKENLHQNELAEVKTVEVMKEDWPSAAIALIKMPKSLELFELYLAKLVHCLSSEATVLCGFMTRHFTPAWLKVAQQYFEVVEQSRAKKKARLLILKKPIPRQRQLISSFVDDSGQEWSQYFGVFSSGRLDTASRFFMDHLKVPKGAISVLDVGCGNGVLGKFIQTKNPEAKLSLLDDNLLAVLSAQLNVSETTVEYHWSSDLSPILPKSQDFVVCNPPFHFEYEINLDVAHRIFREVAAVLKDTGEFWIVANNHLPYKPQLQQHFRNCEIVARNQKFFVYKCWKN